VSHSADKMHAWIKFDSRHLQRRASGHKAATKNSRLLKIEREIDAEWAKRAKAS